MMWRDIPGYEGLYKISEFGDVKSLERKQMRKLKQGLVEITFKEKIIVSNSITQNTRYKNIRLSKRDGTNKTESHLLHRLVYMSFVGNLKDGYIIDHIDGDRGNNHYTNLQQITQKQNVRKYWIEEIGELDEYKICNECGLKKKRTEFYMKPKKQLKIAVDKHRSKCKYCMKK